MDDQVQFYKAKLQYEIDPSDLHEALGRGDKILLVDTRSPEAYERSHVPGSVNIPHRTMSTTTTAYPDKEALVVTYCDQNTYSLLSNRRIGWRWPQAHPA